MAEAGPYSLWRERSVAGQPFLVCAMFTPDYRQQAERLAASLDRFALGHALFEVPKVHRSISSRGGDDLVFCKPRFIRGMLEAFGGTVLYVDSDMVFRKTPELITRLCGENCDFAIYNWLADPVTDAWLPSDREGRFWKFYFKMDVLSDSQLGASGAVQLWKAGPAAFALLEDWEKSLQRHPDAEDDHCLDFAYNHRENSGLKARWLPKEYCRYAFWPYADPVIDHPEFPAPASGHFRSLGVERFNRDRIRRVDKEAPFPRYAILDAKNGQMLTPDGDGRLAPAGTFPRPLYLPHV